jgi:hypothetical protein
MQHGELVSVFTLSSGSASDHLFERNILITEQFGFDGDDLWKGRRDNLLGTLHSNPKAKFVTRVVQFGSEPLFDWVLDPPVLAAQVVAAKANLSSLQIPVTVSDMAYSYQEVGTQCVMFALSIKRYLFALACR